MVKVFCSTTLNRELSSFQEKRSKYSKTCLSKPNTKRVHPLFVTVVKAVAVGCYDAVDDVESEDKVKIDFC